MGKKDDDGEVTSVRMEYGLVLPNGEVCWNVYRSHPIQTPQERWVLWQALRKTADEIGFTEEDFLSRYSWQSRSVTTIIKNQRDWPIDSDHVCQPPQENPTNPTDS